MHMIRLRKEFGSNSDLIARGECAIQFQDYSEARVISRVMVEFQATGEVWVTLMLKVKCRILTPRLVLELVIPETLAFRKV
ncbi:Dynein Heavy Chain 11, Axonemal [Manis pentadactyla]|nr:Dynein Heavy Chain 11, Axonemal [Manis pentadactyla]